ncbi:hypothetical protein F3Y22_tig00111095pilonHSYRG00972 [Hibiscus syriacus]|uniref:Ubiquitin-like protease family profile domain-containing protein n=1 Tax=Hibiscus syriacus TaxID=106335 RepID=A0A6A2Z1R8_HIBSY|nr:hypothetical protein F3Y22_tig00111095pilonHSYRG00972 [Hibiscus syriacus]
MVNAEEESNFHHCLTGLMTMAAVSSSGGDGGLLTRLEAEKLARTSHASIMDNFSSADGGSDWIRTPRTIGVPTTADPTNDDPRQLEGLPELELLQPRKELQPWEHGTMPTNGLLCLLVENFYSAQLTLRNKVSLAKTIASKLSPAQRKMFEDTCFGPWLKVQYPGGDAMLTHMFLQTMTRDLPDTIQRRDEEIWFDFPLAYTCFGREEFFLITGLRFGHDDVGRYTRHITRPSWLSRVFPELERPNLHVEDLTRLLNKKDGFTRMDDIDVVRGYFLEEETNLAMGRFTTEANPPLQRMTPTEAELATDWWQASKRFFDGTDDEQPPLWEPSPHPELSPNPELSPDRPDYTPPQRQPSPILSHHRASSPTSPQDRRPAKLPRRLSPCSPPPPPRDELGELRVEVNALREEVGTLRKDDGVWRVEVSTLRGEVAALREMVASLQNEVHTLRNERPDKVDALHRVFLARRSSRIRRRARAITSPFTPMVRRLRKKKPDSPVIPQESPPIVQEAPIIPQESPPPFKRPLSSLKRSLPPFQSPIHMGTLPVSEVERRQLSETILDNTLWAKTAVDFYLHERSQGCYTDISKLNDEMYLLLNRSWWGVLLGVEDSGYFDGDHIDAWVSRLLIIRKLRKNKKNSRYTIMPAAFHAVHLKNQRDESFSLGNGQAKLYPVWWEVDKVFIPVLERRHWLLVQLQLPSLKIIVYASMINYISLSYLRDIIKRWSSHLAKFLDEINYWTHSGHKKPKKFNVTVVRDETAPQQSLGARGDCGPLVCMCLARLTTGSTEFLPPTDRDRAAVGLCFRHYMARAIYSRRCLPASAL